MHDTHIDFMVSATSVLVVREVGASEVALSDAAPAGGNDWCSCADV